MASASDIALVKLFFKFRDDMSFTDDEISSLLDSPMSVIDVAIFIADAYLAQYATESDKLTVGPITIDSSSAYEAWDKLKRDLLVRKNQGAGVPGSSGVSPLIAMGGASLGCTTPDVFWTGQLDNPPVQADDCCQP